ncbi:MAG: hypothetical protein ACT4OW_01680 [Nitrososphaerota archaeon]
MQKAHTKETKAEISPKVEKILEDIDSGKVKMTRYKNADEYLKHVDEVLSE